MGTNPESEVQNLISSSAVTAEPVFLGEPKPPKGNNPTFSKRQAGNEEIRARSQRPCKQFSDIRSSSTVIKFLSKFGTTINSSALLRTVACFLLLTAFVIGIGINYYDVSPSSWLLYSIATGISGSLTTLFFFSKLIRFALYLSFVDSHSKVLRVLAIALILSTLTRGPVFRIWSTASLIPNSLECAKEVTARNVTDIFEEMYDWNGEALQLQTPFTSLANLLKTVEETAVNVSETFRDLRFDCRTAIDTLQQDCIQNTNEAYSSCMRKLTLTRHKRGAHLMLSAMPWLKAENANVSLVYTPLCNLVKVANEACSAGLTPDLCNVIISPFEILEIHKIAQRLQNMLNVTVLPRFSKPHVAIESEVLQTYVNRTVESAKRILENFETAQSIFSHATVVFLVLRIFYNAYILRKSGSETGSGKGLFQFLKRQAGQMFCHINSYLPVFIITLMALLLYIVDFSLRHGYCNLASAIGNNSIQVNSSNTLSMEMESGLVGNMFVAPLDMAYSSTVNLSYEKCFPGCLASFSTVEVITCGMAVMALYISILVNGGAEALKYKIVSCYQELRRNAQN